METFNLRDGEKHILKQNIFHLEKNNFSSSVQHRLH